MFSCQFYEKRVSVRERNIKSLLASVNYIDRNRNLYFTIQTFVHCRKYHLYNSNGDSHLHNCNGDSHLHNTIKIVTHIFDAETVICISAN